jgi:hypothetical protein
MIKNRESIVNVENKSLDAERDNPVVEIWARLLGEPYDLDCLAKIIDDPAGWRVVAEGNGYVLKGLDIDPAADGQEQRGAAEEGISMVIGAASVDLAVDVDSVKFGGLTTVHQNGNRGTVIMPDPILLQARSTMAAVSRGDTPATREQSVPERALALAQMPEHYNLRDALIFLGQSKSWFMLYKVFEEVLEGAGAEKRHTKRAANFLASSEHEVPTLRREMDRFRETANNFHRHNSRAKYDVSRHGEAMSFAEANEFVRSLVRRLAFRLYKG